MNIFRYYADFYQMRVHCTLTYFMDWVTRIPRPDGANEAYSEIGICMYYTSGRALCGNVGRRVCVFVSYSATVSGAAPRK